MSNKTQLPVEVVEEIKKGAQDTLTRASSDLSYSAGYYDGYSFGATAYATRLHEAQQQIKRLLDTLEKIVHAPVPANEREYMSWFVTAKNIAGGAISAHEAEIEAQQWKKGKEVGNEG